MVYALSDIHGNERRFNSIMEQINLREEDTLYILGDIIDRYPGGIQILQKIMNMPNVEMLLGNDEHMMLRAVGRPYDEDDVMSDFDLHCAQMLWHRNGGSVTHHYWKSLQEDLQIKIVNYLRGLPLNINIEVNEKNYKLVHGAPVEDYHDGSEYGNSTQFAVWERLNQKEMEPKDYVLIFGRTPTAHYQKSIPMKLWYGKNCIGVDCGSGYPETGFVHQMGRLACLRLDDGKVFYSNESIEVKCYA